MVTRLPSPARTISGRILLIGLAALAAGCSLALAGEADGADDRRIGGPVAVDVVKVRDGDTVEVEAHIWPQQTVRVAVRLRGIDAPEMRAKCAAEKDAALLARDRLAELLKDGDVALTNVSGDKYFGRVLAEMSSGAVADVAARLLEEGLVASYQGKARRDWCLASSSSSRQAAPSRPRSG